MSDQEFALRLSKIIATGLIMLAAIWGGSCTAQSYHQDASKVQIQLLEKEMARAKAEEAQALANKSMFDSMLKK